MSYKRELEDLILRLRNRALTASPDALPPDELFGVRLSWPEQFDRWAEIIEFAIGHPDEFKANLDEKS